MAFKSLGLLTAYVHGMLWFMVVIPANNTAAQPPLKYISPDADSACSAAVLVRQSQLLHTTQLLPTTVAVESKPVAAEGQLSQVLQQLDQILAACNARREQIAKLNFYVADSQTRSLVMPRLMEWCAREHLPAVSYVSTRLPVSGAVVGLDAVVAIGGNDSVLPSCGSLEQGKRAADWCSMPAGDIVYVSGQAEAGDLAGATAATLQSLLRSLEHLKLSRQHIVGLKCFLTPMDQVAVVNEEISRFFQGEMIPPVSHVQWISDAHPIEIELIASAPPSETSATVSYLSLPWMNSSPIYSRVARLHGDRRIYVSGLVSRSSGDGATQVKDVFHELDLILGKAGSDMRHLAKATYYVSDDDASSQLNAIRPSIYDPKRPPAASKAFVADVSVPGRSITLDIIAAPTPGDGVREK